MANPDIGRNPRTPPTKAQLRDFFRSVRLSMKAGAETAVVGQQWGARQNTGTAGTDYTYHQTFTVERAAGRFRFKLLNTNTSPMTVQSMAMAVSDRLGTGAQRYTPSTGVWVPVTVRGAQSVVLPAGAANRPSITWTDWIDCETISPADGTTLPVVMWRAYVPAGAFSVGNYDFSPWAAPSGINDGRFLFSFRNALDFVSGTQDGFPGTAYPNPFLMGFEYETAGPAFTYAWHGNSITEAAVNGSIGNFGNGMAWQATKALRAANPSIAIGYVNNGLSGSPSDTFLNRLYDFIVSGANFNASVYSAFSPNDGTPTGTTTANEITRLTKALGMLDRLGKPTILWTPTVNTAAGWDTTADNFRKALRTTLLGSGYSTRQVVDIEAALSDGATPARFAPANTTDGTHPNEVGYAAMAPLFQAAMQTVLTSADLLAA